MTKHPDYEAHVTLWPKDRDKVGPIAKQHKFKLSELVGDVKLGNAPLLYLTSHDRTAERLGQRMADMVDHLRAVGVEVLRDKLEHVMFDNIHVDYKHHPAEH